MLKHPRTFAAVTLLLMLAAIPAGADNARYVVPAGNSPAIGPANAPVTIVEFLDYQ